MPVPGTNWWQACSVAVVWGGGVVWGRECWARTALIFNWVVWLVGGDVYNLCGRRQKGRLIGFHHHFSVKVSDSFEVDFKTLWYCSSCWPNKHLNRIPAMQHWHLSRLNVTYEKRTEARFVWDENRWKISGRLFCDFPSDPMLLSQFSKLRCRGNLHAVKYCFKLRFSLEVKLVVLEGQQAACFSEWRREQTRSRHVTVC